MGRRQLRSGSVHPAATRPLRRRHVPQQGRHLAGRLPDRLGRLGGRAEGGTDSRRVPAGRAGSVAEKAGAREATAGASGLDHDTAADLQGAVDGQDVGYNWFGGAWL